MRIKQHIAAMALTIFAVQPALAAAEKPCITDAEMHAGITYILPSLIEGLQTKCTPMLPASSYLKSQGPALLSRYKTMTQPNSPALSSLIGKMGMPANMPAVANKAFAEVIAATVVAKMQSDIKPEICPDVDKALALLDPLPAANLVGLFELIATKVDQDSVVKQQSKGIMGKQHLCHVMPVAKK
jgi:hypothetical protein